VRFFVDPASTASHAASVYDQILLAFAALTHLVLPDIAALGWGVRLEGSRPSCERGPAGAASPPGIAALRRASGLPSWATTEADVEAHTAAAQMVGTMTRSAQWRLPWLVAPAPFRMLLDAMRKGWVPAPGIRP